MTKRDLRFTDRASALRLDFDRSFAEPPPAPAPPLEDFLAIRVGTDPYAVRLAEVARLLVDGAVTRLPTPAPELLGITSFRGAIVPVYDLRALLGYPVAETPRWLAIAAQVPVALAFDAFDAHLRLSREASAPSAGGEPAREHLRGVLRADDRVCPIVDVRSILEAIKKRTSSDKPQ